MNNAAATGEGLMAAGAVFAPFEEYPLGVWQETLDVNLTGTFLVAREAGRAMKAGGGGSLVNVSSIYGVVGPDHRIYEDERFKSFPKLFGQQSRRHRPDPVAGYVVGEGQPPRELRLARRRVQWPGSEIRRGIQPPNTRRSYG